jgi:transcriptional regulator GlxA family with amidase domain
VFHEETYRPDNSGIDYFRHMFDLFVMRDQNRPYRVGFLILPKFSMIALSCVMEPLREANWVSGKQLYDWLLITPGGPRVTSSNHTNLMIDNGLSAIRDCDMLIVCASFDLEKHSTPHTLSALRKAARHGVVLGSIDTGSYLLARAGLLDGIAATIHWENATGFAEQFPRVSLTHEIFTIDRNRWTCSGGSSGIDMMLHLIRQQHGVELSVGVAECAILGGIRSGQAAQRLSTAERLNTTDPSLIAAIQVMEANLTTRLSVPEIASQTGFSQRQLERVFRQCLGTTPTAHYLHLRLQRAQLLLRQTSLQVGTIAASCGFTSQAQFSRCYHDRFCMAPSKHRKTGRSG